MARKPLKRIPHKVSSRNQILSRGDNNKILNCKECGSEVENCNVDTKNVTCSRCVAKLIDPPQGKPKPEEKRPRGWQFKARYVSPTGKVYHKGREVDESITRPVKRARMVPTITKKSGKSNGSAPTKKRGRPKGSKNISKNSTGNSGRPRKNVGK